MECVTGLHIGAGGKSMEIGGIDAPVIRHPIGSKRPYVPGSSLKGRMRSLLEHYLELAGDGVTMREFNGIRRHECPDRNTAKDCKVCRLFGSTGDKTQGMEGNNHPARLRFLDGELTPAGIANLTEDGILVTEAKMENTLDRLTSAAMPRTIERVPGTAEFNIRLILRVDADKKEEDFATIKTGLDQIAFAGLGGHVSRGYGHVKWTSCDVLPPDIGDANILKTVLQPVLAGRNG